MGKSTQKINDDDHGAQTTMSSDEGETEPSPTIKLADMTAEPERVAARSTNSYAMPESVDVWIDGQEKSLKTLDSFEQTIEELIEKQEDGIEVEISIRVDNALTWHDGTIQGVVKLTKRFAVEMLWDGEPVEASGFDDVLFQIVIESDDIRGYEKLKNLFLTALALNYRNQVPALVGKVKERLSKLGFPGDGLRELKREENRIREKSVTDNIDRVRLADQLRVADILPGMPISESSKMMVAPRGYSISFRGVSQGGTDDPVFLRTPLVIDAVYRCSTSNRVLIKLIFRGPGGYISRVVSRDTICDQRKLLELSAYGLPVTNDNAMQVVRFLAAFERDNASRIEQGETTNRLGIHFVERRIPRVTDSEIKLSNEWLANCKVQARLRFPNNSSPEVEELQSEQARSWIEDRKRSKIETLRHRRAASLLAECELAIREGLEGPELPNGIETVRTTVFVLPDTAYSSHMLEPNIRFVPDDPAMGEQAAGFRCKGQKDDFLELLRDTAEYPQVRLAVVAAFAPLLRIFIEFPNLILDFCGRTTSGKTTTLRLAAAGFGCPNQSDATGSVIFSLAGTATFNERRAGLLQNLPLFLDESKLAEPTSLSKFAYMIASGTSKGRGTVQGVQATTKFETVGIFTGEQPVTAASKDGGARLRAIPFFGGPFGEQSPEIDQLADRINETVEHNYGHALPAMLTYIMDKQHLWPKWQKRFAEHKRVLRLKADNEDNKFAARLVPTLAAFRLSEELLHHCLGVASIDVVEQNWNNFVQETSVADQASLALEFVFNYTVQNRSRFWDAGRQYQPKDHEPHGGWLGRWDLAQNSKVPGEQQETSWSYIGYPPAELKSLLDDQGYDADAVLRQWKLDAYLICDSDRPTHQVNFGHDKLRTRLICIRKSATDSFSSTESHGHPEEGSTEPDGMDHDDDSAESDETDGLENETESVSA